MTKNADKYIIEIIYSPKEPENQIWGIEGRCYGNREKELYRFFVETKR